MEYFHRFRNLYTSLTTKDLRNSSYPLLIILFVGFLIYSNTFGVPFHFDDRARILGDPSIRHLGSFISSFSLSRLRFVGNLTFALNYQINGLSVFGYHLVNLIIHLLASVMVFKLISLTLTTPVMKTKEISKYKYWIGFLSALIFVSHPIQTQAVTYIVQRLASLATLFYLLSLYWYVKGYLVSLDNPAEKKNKAGLKSANSLRKVVQIKTSNSRKQIPDVDAQSFRLEDDKIGRKIPVFNQRSIYYYTGSAISAFLGLYTKEIVFTLPLMILVYHLFFLSLYPVSKQIKKLLLIGVPLVTAGVLIAFTMYSASYVFKEKLTNSGEIVGSYTYLLTQFRVLVKYLQLLFLPLQQNLDYYFPISRSFFEASTLMSFALLLILVITAVKLFKSHRLLSFGIFWFFITLLTESSVIPIGDVIYEHRLYLPMMGFGLFVVTGLFVLFSRNLLKISFGSFSYWRVRKQG